MDLHRETDVEQLRKIALVQQSEIERLLALLQAQSARIDALTGEAGEQQRMLELLQRQAGEVAPSQDEARRPRRKKKRAKKKRESFGPTPQPDLPVTEETFVLDEADQVCTACGGELKPFEGQFEESEMVDVVQLEYRLVRVQRQKYVCNCGGCVDTALGPERATAGSRYSLDFATKVAVDKYLDHLPLERQARIMKRHGLKVGSQTLWKQLGAIARELEPVYEALLDFIRSQPVIGVDQTSWMRLDKKAKTTPWQMWCLTSPGAVAHAIRDDKSTESFKALLGDYEGTLVCDMFKTHFSGARDGPIELAGCWAHAFRKFRDAAPNHPDAIQVMNWISELYDLDAKAGDDVELRKQIRDTESRTTIGRLKTFLKSLPVLQSLDYGKAAQYVLGYWEPLTRFLEDPRIPLDNNATERGIRGPVIGRRNHFGSKSAYGTRVASLFYSLLETAKLQGLEPAAYLRDAVIAARRGELRLPFAD
ncbi:MAG: IS66 family transposase [Myxococcota bacterium]